MRVQFVTNIAQKRFSVSPHLDLLLGCPLEGSTLAVQYGCRRPTRR